MRVVQPRVHGGHDFINQRFLYKEKALVLFLGIFLLSGVLTGPTDLFADAPCKNDSTQFCDAYTGGSTKGVLKSKSRCVAVPTEWGPDRKTGTPNGSFKGKIIAAPCTSNPIRQYPAYDFSYQLPVLVMFWMYIDSNSYVECCSDRFSQASFWEKSGGGPELARIFTTHVRLDGTMDVDHAYMSFRSTTTKAALKTWVLQSVYIENRDCKTYVTFWSNKQIVAKAKVENAFSDDFNFGELREAHFGMYADRKVVQCSDGIDNDGDGKTDYPADPECVSAQDHSEEFGGSQPGPGGKFSVLNDDFKIFKVANKGDAIKFIEQELGSSGIDIDKSDNNPEPPNPECSDGNDNDGDGEIDYPTDPDCSGRSDDDERAFCSVSSGDSCTYGNYQNQGCGANNCPTTQMSQKRTAPEPDCPPEYRCVDNNQCAPPKPQVTISAISPASGTAQAPADVEITYSTTQACSPLSFYKDSTLDKTSNTQGIQNNVKYKFEKLPAGIYDLKVVCQNSNGNGEDQYNNYEVKAALIPTLNFSANPSTIITGAKSTLTWNSANINTCQASGGWSGSKSTNGTEPALPKQTMSYTLSCSGAIGPVSRSVTVTVKKPAPQVTIFWPSNNSSGGSDVDMTFAIGQGCIIRFYDKFNGIEKNFMTTGNGAGKYTYPIKGLSKGLHELKVECSNENGLGQAKTLYTVR